MDSNKKDSSSEDLLEQLRMLRQEVSGLREQNVQMKKELSDVNAYKRDSVIKYSDDNEYEDIINLDAVLKKIDQMKRDNSDFLSAVSDEATTVYTEDSETLTQNVEPKIEQVQYVAPKTEFMTNEPVNNKLSRLDFVEEVFEEVVLEKVVLEKVTPEFEETEVVSQVEETVYEESVENVELTLEENSVVDLIEDVVEKAVEQKATNSLEVSPDGDLLIDFSEDTVEIPSVQGITIEMEALKFISEFEDTVKADSEEIELQISEEKNDTDFIENFAKVALVSSVGSNLDEFGNDTQIEENVENSSTTEALEVMHSEDLIGSTVTDPTVENFGSDLETGEVQASVNRSLDEILSQIELETENLVLNEEAGNVDSLQDIVDDVAPFNSLKDIVDEVDLIHSEIYLNESTDLVKPLEENNPGILDISLEPEEAHNDKLSLTMILADTQELNTFAIESELEAELQRRANAKAFDPKNSDIDKDGNIVNPKKNNKFIYIFMGVLVAVLALFFVRGGRAIGFTDKEDPQIELTSEKVYVTEGEEYNLETGITVSDNRSDESYLLENLTVVSTPEFNTDITGTYEVVFTVTDKSGNLTSVTQSVSVVPEGYELVLSVPQDELVVQAGENVDLMADVSATNGLEDSVELTSKVEVSSNPTFDSNTPGTYEITYTVTDSTGNIATAKRNVVVEEAVAKPAEEPAEQASQESTDTTPPVVSVTAPDVTINAGDPFDVTDGVYASDDVSSVDYVWGHMQMTSEPSFDSNTPGTYYITFIFADEAGNSTTANRVVRVV